MATEHVCFESKAAHFRLKLSSTNIGEEVFLLSGDPVAGNDAQGKGGEPFQNYTYAVRPPGVYHGPFASKGGCLMLETHFFDDGK